MSDIVCSTFAHVRVVQQFKYSVKHLLDGDAGPPPGVLVQDAARTKQRTRRNTGQKQRKVRLGLREVKAERNKTRTTLACGRTKLRVRYWRSPPKSLKQQQHRDSSNEGGKAALVWGAITWYLRSGLLECCYTRSNGEAASMYLLHA